MLNFFMVKKMLQRILNRKLLPLIIGGTSSGVEGSIHVTVSPLNLRVHGEDNKFI